MVRAALTKINEVQSRHTLYLPKDLIEDSQFPFKPGEKLVVIIDVGKLIIEKAKR